MSNYNLDTMTAQEVFDASAVHLVTQGAPSQGVGSCMYRGPHLRRCAAGIFIPDEVYAKFNDPTSDFYNNKLEGKNWENARAVAGLSKAHSSLIEALQQCHDQNSERPHWFISMVDELRSVAFGYRLNTDALDSALAKKESQCTQ